MTIYVDELKNPIIKFNMLLSDKKTIYKILVIQDIKVRIGNFNINVSIIHTSMIEPKNMELNNFKLNVFILNKLSHYKF